MVGAQKLARGWLNLNFSKYSCSLATGRNSNLTGHHFAGLPDVFCKIECGSQNWTTETCLNTVNPVWRWVHDVDIGRSDSIVISLWNQKKVNRGGRKGFMGCVRILPAAISSLKDQGFQRLDLQKLNEDDQEVVRGAIIISLLSKDPHSNSRHQNNVVIQQQENNMRPLNIVPCPVPSSRVGSNSNTAVNVENESTNVLPSRHQGSSRPQPRLPGEREADRSGTSSRERSHFERNARSSSARVPKAERRPLNANHGNSTSNPQINVLDNQANCSSNASATTNNNNSTCNNNNTNTSTNTSTNTNTNNININNNNHNNTNNNSSNNINSTEEPRSSRPSLTNVNNEAAISDNPIPTARRSARGHRHTSHSSRNQHNSPATSSNLAFRLPEGYEMRTSDQGQIYFIHLPSNTTTYYDPRVPKQVTDLNLNLDHLFGPLPDGWEMRQAPPSSNSSNRVYFLNHITRTTQFTDPRLIQNLNRLKEILDQSGINGLLNRCKVQPVRQSTPVNNCNRIHKPPMPLPETDLTSSINKQPIKKNLIAKMQAFKLAIQPLQTPNGHCRLEVSRKDIFEDSFSFVMKMKTKELRKRLMVKFRGEEGIDYGGVAREWLHLLSREMLNPQYALFKYTADHIFTLQINPDSGINSVSNNFCCYDEKCHVY